MIDVPAQIKNDYSKLLAQRGIPRVGLEPTT